MKEWFTDLFINFIEGRGSATFLYLCTNFGFRLPKVALDERGNIPHKKFGKTIGFTIAGMISSKIISLWLMELIFTKTLK